MIQPIEKQDAIWQPGKRIVNRIESQFFLGLFANGNIGLRTRHPVRNTVVTPDREAATHHPPVVALGVLHAVLALEMPGLRRLVRVELGDDTAAIIRMNAGDPFLWVAANSMILETEHGFPAG